MYRCLLVLLLGCTTAACFAQFQVRDSSLFNPHISLSYGLHIPGGDLADRFGTNQTAGVGFHIKSKTNWYYGVQFNYLFGNTVKEPRLLQNLLTEDGFILDNQGQIATLYIQQRGYGLTANFGRLFNFCGPNPNSGLLLMVGGGLLQHRIRIEHQETEIRQLDGDYEDGYDRLTNGFTLYQFAGYFLMSNNKLVNFYAGIESYQAFTQNRRDMNFDTMETDTRRRKDQLLGFRVGWVLHLYQRSPDKYYFN